MNDRILTEIDGHVLHICVNRPEKRYAFDLATLAQLAAAYQRLAEDPPAFASVCCAPVGITSRRDSISPRWARLSPRMVPTCWPAGAAMTPFGLLAQPVPKPVVMAVSGIAFTLSIELALASDIVVAAEDVRFRQLEIGRGILPFGGATFRAPANSGGATPCGGC